MGVPFEVMALTGLRRGEAVGLRWQDVDLERAQLTVRQQVIVVDGARLVGPPKTRSGEHRRVDLDSGTAQMLAEHRVRQRDQLAQVGLAGPADDRVVTDALGRGMSPEHVTRQLKAIAERAGLPVKRLHDLRHGSARCSWRRAWTSRSSRSDSDTRPSAHGRYLQPLAAGRRCGRGGTLGGASSATSYQRMAARAQVVHKCLCGGDRGECRRHWRRRERAGGSGGSGI